MSEKPVSKELQDKVNGKANNPEESNLPVKQDPFSSFVEEHKKDFAMVIPSHIKPERIMRLAISAYRRTPELMNCALETVIGGVLESASLGLEINTPLKQASLIPFRNNKTKRTEAELIIQYRGYVDLMYNHPKVLSVFANVVFEQDDFECVYGTNETLHHVESDKKDRGEILGFYAYAKLRDGAYRFIYLKKSKVDGIRDEYSPSYRAAKESSPWHTHYQSMGMKTAIRALERFVPKSAEIAKAADADHKVFSKQDIMSMEPMDAEVID